MKTKQIIPMACAAVGLLCTSSLRAVNTDTWNGGAADHDWFNAANWSTYPNLPTSGLSGTGDLLNIDSAGPNDYAIYSAADGSTTYGQIRVGYTANGRLDVTGGTLIGDSSNQARVGVAGHTGILNIAGGSFLPGGIAQIGLDDGSVGIVNVSSGVYAVTRGATQDGIANTSIALGAGHTGQGTLNLTGGNVYTRFGVEVGQSSLAGSGAFNVYGAGSALIGGNNGNNASNTGFWWQRGNGTLAATVDSSGFTLGSIDIYNNGGAGTAFVTFDAGSTLSLGFSGAAPTSTMSWDLMTWESNTTVTDNGLTLAPGDAAAGWSFAVGPNALSITFTPVPEPTTVAMLGLGLLAVFSCARRRV